MLIGSGGELLWDERRDHSDERDESGDENQNRIDGESHVSPTLAE